jgi:hypothetical protein
MSRYINEKFFEALFALVGTSSIDIRLTLAAKPLLPLQEKQLPEEMRDEFKTLRDALTKIPLSTTTDYQPRPISEDDGRKLAEQILEMYTKLMGGL